MTTTSVESAFEAGVRQLRCGLREADAIARDLVGQLAEEERLGLLDGDQGFWTGIWDIARNGYNHAPIIAGAVPRLGIPGIRFTDGPRGIVMGRSTCFPVAMARGATWDIALEEEIGRAIGAEGRAQGANLFAGVCINLLRHPAWGRAQETYGEDPVLLGRMGAALTRGVRTHLMACVKHFALNSIENARFVVDVRVDDESLHAVYLPHFREVIDAGAEAVMSAYNAVNGEWCGDSPYLLTRILRDEWGFSGFVMSDFIFGHRDPVGSVAAGLDLEMPFAQQRARQLPQALAAGTLNPGAVDSACVRLVATQLRYAARLARDVPGTDVVASRGHRALARRAASQAMVLLRNESVLGQPLLPLAAERLRRVAVIGRLATRANLGDRGSSSVRPPATASPLQGLRDALADVAVDHDAGQDPQVAAQLAAGADVAVVVVGYSARDEGEGVLAPFDEAIHTLPPPIGWPLGRILDWLAAEASLRRLVPGGDRARLTLSEADEELILEVAKAQARTVVVVVGASAVLMERWRTSVPAILLAWYPGMEGGRALADVLLGAAEPGGRLPFVMPADVAHLPHFDARARTITYDRWWGQRLLDRDEHVPAFPFGFGLGYGRVEIRGVELQTLDVEAQSAVVSVAVTNAGSRTSGSVVQVYAETDAAELPRRQLVGFARAVLAPAESAEITVEVSLRPLSRRDSTSRVWSVLPGRYRLVAAQYCGDPTGQAIPLELG